ncbi:MAG: hypothetical protein ACYDEN_06995 [Acidimicrobiales bacterium]
MGITVVELVLEVGDPEELGAALAHPDVRPAGVAQREQVLAHA